MKRFVFMALVLLMCLAGCQIQELPEETQTQPTAVTTQPTQPVQTTAPTQLHVHAYTETVVDPTCTEGGYTLFTCSCGEQYQDKKTDALGHDETEQVVEASDEAPGYTEYTCQRCDAARREKFTFTAATPTDFFDDAAFVGDSITLGLRNYHMDRGFPLGDVTFLCQGSYSVDHAVNDTMLISYQGQDMTLEEALVVSGAKKVFIQLGMNDIALHGVDKTMENWGVMLDGIRKAAPDIAVYIQSGTPIYTAGQIGGLNNQRMDAYNVRLRQFAEENGCFYIDIATDMKDSGNGLQERYASDNYVHLTYAACKLWVTVLKNYVGG